MDDIQFEIDVRNTEVMNLKWELEQTDYKAIKYAEGLIPDGDYQETRNHRNHIRARINRLEEEMEELGKLLGRDAVG